MEGLAQLHEACKFQLTDLAPVQPNSKDQSAATHQTGIMSTLICVDHDSSTKPLKLVQVGIKLINQLNINSLPPQSANQRNTAKLFGLSGSVRLPPASLARKCAMHEIDGRNLWPAKRLRMIVACV